MMLATGQLERADYVVLVGYFALMLGIGAYFYRYMRGMKDYFSGGNRIPWWLSGVSFYMSSFSVAAFVQYSALAYLYGWVAVTLYWVTVPATLVSVMFFSKLWRRARIDSPVEYLETRYSPVIRQIFAWQGIPVRIIDDAFKLVAIGIFIHKGIGVDMKTSMLGAGLIMLTYTFMGGLWAVTVTDFVQFVVMTVAIVILLPLSIKAAGGFGGLIENAPEGFFHLTHPEYGWVYVVSNLLLFSLAFSSIQWSLIQRYYCVPRERDAYKVGGLVVALNFIGPPLMFLPAMAARQFLPGIEEGGQVYPMLCAGLLPVGMFGLVVAAMFSATMSMLSSDYNVCASVLTNDVYRRLVRPGATQAELVWMGRLMTLVVGVLALGLAWMMADVGGEGLFRNMIKLFSVATAPVALPMLAGLLSRRITGRAALSGFVVGVVVGLFVFFTYPDSFEFLGTAWKKENAIFFGAAIGTLGPMLLVTLYDRHTDDERKRVDAFLGKLAIPIGALEEDRPAEGSRKVFSPFRVVGLSIALIGVLMLAVVNAVDEALAHRMDLWIGVALIAIGGVMVATSWRRKRPSEEMT